MPHFFASPDAMQSVWEKGAAGMAEYFQLIEDRLAAGDWWYGSQWSAMDAYLYWVWFRITGAGFDAAPFAALAHHTRRMEQRPAVQRALQREAEAQAMLEAQGLAFPLPAMEARL